MKEKSRNISKFSNSLIEYLINAMADRHSEVRYIAQRLNNLKIFMDPFKQSEPHFFVSIGISEACYDIETGRKIDGSLGPEDSYVSRWAMRSNINGELKNYWKKLLEMTKEEEELLSAQEDSVTKAIDAIPMRKEMSAPDEIDEESGVEMMGTGTIRYRNRGKRRYLYKGDFIELTPDEYAALLAADAEAEIIPEEDL